MTQERPSNLAIISTENAIGIDIIEFAEGKVNQEMLILVVEN